jgi:hypothetical protein
MGALATAALVIPHSKTFSAKTVRFLRDFVTNYVRKRALVFGGTSVGTSLSRLSFGSQSKIETGMVRPPLLDSSGEASDPRTRGVFVGEYWDQMIAASAGVAGGWVGGHYSSLAVKSVLPKWTSVTRASWARGKVADFASPGVLTGFAVTFYLSYKISEGMSNHEFQKDVSAAKANLNALAGKVTAAVAAKNEYDVWLKSEQLKNGLMLQNYLLTRNFTQNLSDESERYIRGTLARFSNCGFDRERILAGQRTAFKKRVAAEINREKINLLAALDITQSVQEILLAGSDAMTGPLIETNGNLLTRDRWILDADSLGEEMWQDIVGAVKDVHVECAAQAPGYFP